MAIVIGFMALLILLAWISIRAENRHYDKVEREYFREDNEKHHEEQ